MSYFVWIEIVCTSCATTIAGRNTCATRVPRREMAAEAESRGWQRVNTTEWVCPSKVCREKEGLA